MKNGVQKILEDNGFILQESLVTGKGMHNKGGYKKASLRFSAIDMTFSSSKADYTLTLTHNKFGFLTQTYIV